jgi:hypothetical protein
MQKNHYISMVLVALVLVMCACQERTDTSPVKKSRLAEQDRILNAQDLEQREQQLAQKVAAMNTLMATLEQKESELLIRENRLLEFEKKLSEVEIQLNERKDTLDKFRTTSIGILLLGILFLTGGIVLFIRVQQRKNMPVAETFRPEVKIDPVIKQAPDTAVMVPPKRKK